MKAAILEKPRPVEQMPTPEPVMKLESRVSATAQKHERRPVHPRYWIGEFNGLWCDEELY